MTCWVDGSNADILDAMPEEEQIEIVLGEFARIRPSTAEKVTIAKIVSWGNDPYSKGAYANYLPGQVSRLKPGDGQAVAPDPLRRRAHRGDHARHGEHHRNGATGRQ